MLAAWSRRAAAVRETTAPWAQVWKTAAQLHRGEKGRGDIEGLKEKKSETLI